MPYFRQISLTGRPASASLRMVMICVSVNFDCRMRTSWLRGTILPEDSPFGLSQFGGSLRRYFAVPSESRQQLESGCLKLTDYCGCLVSCPEVCDERISLEGPRTF